MTETLPDTLPDALADSAPETSPDRTVKAQSSSSAAAPGAAKSRRGARPENAALSLPVLEKLAALYPYLFGASFLPLKRGIFQDIQDAHPEMFEREALKAALSLHTRSASYLTVVAAGQKRHDLQGDAVEDMAPEHVYHALLEVFRRRHKRAGEDVRPRLRRRILQAFDASGLSREAYADLVRSRDEAANAVLDEAMAEALARAAKDEALLRAFDASGQTVEAFADMYGIAVNAAAASLERARRLRLPTTS